VRTTDTRTLVAPPTVTTREAIAEGKAWLGPLAADLPAINSVQVLRLSSGCSRELPWQHNHNTPLLPPSWLTTAPVLLVASTHNSNCANL
jgi:hypothetical protein